MPNRESSRDGHRILAISPDGREKIRSGARRSPLWDKKSALYHGFTGHLQVGPAAEFLHVKLAPAGEWQRNSENGSLEP
jgi:hypothetical protein